VSTKIALNERRRLARGVQSRPDQMLMRQHEGLRPIERGLPDPTEGVGSSVVCVGVQAGEFSDRN
jgi:hypothetical protein